MVSIYSINELKSLETLPFNNFTERFKTSLDILFYLCAQVKDFRADLPALSHNGGNDFQVPVSKMLFLGHVSFKK